MDSFKDFFLKMKIIILLLKIQLEKSILMDKIKNKIKMNKKWKIRIQNAFQQQIK